MQAGPYYNRLTDFVLRIAHRGYPASSRTSNSVDNEVEYHNLLILKLANQLIAPLVPPPDDPVNSIYVLSCKSVNGEFIWDSHEHQADPNKAHNISTKQSYLYTYMESGFQVATVASRLLTRLRDPWEEKFPASKGKDKNNDQENFRAWQTTLLNHLRSLPNAQTTPMLFYVYDEKRDRFDAEVWINGKVTLSLSSNEELADMKKKQGNEAYQAKNYTKALQLYTEAIELQPNNHILYSNRSSCYVLLREPQKALEDAEKCITLNSTFPKGYYRKAQALRQLGKFKDALEAIEAALKLAPSDSILQSERHELQALAEPTSQESIVMRVCGVSRNQATKALEDEDHNLIDACLSILSPTKAPPIPEGALGQLPS